jgi:hypothetical protein
VSGAVLLRNFSVLVDVDLTQDKYHARRARLLVACTVPGAPEEGPLLAPLAPQAAAIVEQCRAGGCSVGIHRAGVRLDFDPGIVDGLFAPGAFQRIAGAIPYVVALAESLGATSSPLP